MFRKLAAIAAIAVMTLITTAPAAMAEQNPLDLLTFPDRYKAKERTLPESVQKERACFQDAITKLALREPAFRVIALKKKELDDLAKYSGCRLQDGRLLMHSEARFAKFLVANSDQWEKTKKEVMEQHKQALQVTCQEVADLGQKTNLSAEEMRIKAAFAGCEIKTGGSIVQMTQNPMRTLVMEGKSFKTDPLLENSKITKTGAGRPLNTTCEAIYMAFATPEERENGTISADTRYVLLVGGCAVVNGEIGALFMPNYTSVKIVSKH